jgi:hypothetical protein
VFQLSLSDQFFKWFVSVPLTKLYRLTQQFDPQKI